MQRDDENDWPAPSTTTVRRSPSRSPTKTQSISNNISSPKKRRSSNPKKDAPPDTNSSSLPPINLKPTNRAPIKIVDQPDISAGEEDYFKVKTSLGRSRQGDKFSAHYNP